MDRQRRIDEWTDGCMVGYMDGWVDGYIPMFLVSSIITQPGLLKETLNLELEA